MEQQFMNDLYKQIAKQLNITTNQINAVLKLLEEHHIEKIEINDEINTIAILFANLIVLKYVHYKIEKEM